MVISVESFFLGSSAVVGVWLLLLSVWLFHSTICWWHPVVHTILLWKSKMQCGICPFRSLTGDELMMFGCIWLSIMLTWLQRGEYFWFKEIFLNWMEIYFKILMFFFQFNFLSTNISLPAYIVKFFTFLYSFHISIWYFYYCNLFIF